MILPKSLINNRQLVFSNIYTKDINYFLNQYTKYNDNQERETDTEKERDLLYLSSGALLLLYRFPHVDKFMFILFLSQKIIYISCNSMFSNLQIRSRASSIKTGRLQECAFKF